jgi:hypothetical protein
MSARKLRSFQFLTTQAKRCTEVRSLAHCMACHAADLAWLTSPSGLPLLKVYLLLLDGTMKSTHTFPTVFPSFSCGMMG